MLSWKRRERKRENKNLRIVSSHLILGRPLLLLPPIPPSITVFSNESTFHMRWPKHWSFSFSIIPSKEIPGLISFIMDWLDLLAVQGTLNRNSYWACWELGFQACAQSTCPELSAQGLVPLRWGCALPSPNAPGKAPNHIHTTLRWALKN